ncbi:hypothetical protein B0H14DRAFT_3444434 [Mycena olivaceomarginata]|nr:hypothetical protein B0H14DRAFT_3444434 [Mycena olivaceomarginata]
MFSDFGELLTGIVTVRAFSTEKNFMDGLHSRINETTKFWIILLTVFMMTERWLLINLDLLGLAITAALTFSESVYWECRFWTVLELALDSGERIIEYTDLPQKPPHLIESQRPSACRPSSAANISPVSVLHDVSFGLKAGERREVDGGLDAVDEILATYPGPSSGH